MTKAVSVVVPTLRSGNQLLRCLESLLNQTLTPYEIIVVDACSRSEKFKTDRVITSSSIRYYVQNRRGLVYAYNYGAQKSKGEIIAFVDDDTMADPAWLDEISQVYAFSENVGAVGGRMVECGSYQAISIDTLRELAAKYVPFKVVQGIFNEICLENKLNDIGAITRSGAVIGNFFNSTKEPIRVDHLKGANMSFRKDVLEKIGFFNVNFDVKHAPLFETDACYRAKNLNYDIWYNPQATVYHFSNSGGSDLRSLIRNDCLFYLSNIRKSRNHDDLRFALRQVSQVLFFLFVSMLNYRYLNVEAPPISLKS